MKLNINIGSNQIDLAINAVQKDILKLSSLYVNALGEHVVKEAQATTKFNMSQHFNDGITFTQLDDFNGEVKSVVLNSKGVEYSNFLEFGNDPGGGMIYPTKAKALHFVINGEDIFVKSVKAIDPSKLGFMTDATTETIKDAASIFDEAFNKLFQG